MSALPLFELDLPSGVARVLSTLNIIAALIGLVVLSCRVSRLDRRKSAERPFAWAFALAGYAVFGSGLLAVVLAAHGESVDARRIAIFLIVSGAVMLLTRSRRRAS